MEKLWVNRYTYVVSKTNISFIVDFKYDFWELYKDGGSPVTIIEYMGYRPEVLGRRRIYGIAYHIKEQATSPRGLKNNRKKPVAVTEKDCENLAPSSTIKKLQHEVEYLRQEIELLKNSWRENRRNIEFIGHPLYLLRWMIQEFEIEFVPEWKIAVYGKSLHFNETRCICWNRKERHPQMQSYFENALSFCLRVYTCCFHVWTDRSKFPHVLRSLKKPKICFVKPLS